MKIQSVLAVALLATAAQQGVAAVSCASLKSLKLADARITLAEDVTPNPEWKLPPSVFTGPAAAELPGARSTKVPFCRVALTAGKENRIEVWMPRNWNGAFQGVGNGGLTGGIDYPAMAAALGGGFATASTDVGHQTDDFFDTSWITGHPERVTDFGHRAHHQMAVAAKQVVAKYYEKPARKAYYNGCSSGGWQGLTEAQKYPEDYDGIVAGAPAINFVRLQSRTLLEQQLDAKEPGAYVTAELGKLLVDAAVAKCDAYDGVTDGVIDDPRACDFDPAELQCKGGNARGCLKPGEVKRTKWLYGQNRTPQGLKLYPGPALGAPPTTSVPGLDPRHPADMAIVLMMQETPPSLNYKNFDPDTHIPMIEQRFGADLAAMNADLSAFKARGGKLILYHGWADQLLSPYNTIDYYQSVEQKMGPAQQQEFMALFMAPGMFHCGGGPGPSQFDAVDAVMKWVEHGQAPSQLIAAHATAGKVDRTRPLCAWPRVAKYKGSGGTDDAASFSCVAPKST
jgi:feruloyl esterase